MFEVEKSHACGHVSQQRGAAMKRLMNEFGVPVHKHTGRNARSYAPMDLIQAEPQEVADRVVEEGLLPMVHQSRSSEGWATLALRILAMTGQLAPVLRCAPIARYLFEFNLGNHRADLVCWHADGGVSIIEAKGGDGTITGVVAGIGQVTMYALMYLQQCPRPPAYLKKYVVAPVPPEQYPLCVLTAINCNTLFVPVPEFSPGLGQMLAELAAPTRA